MINGIETITYPVKDLAKAKTLFRALAGAEPYMDQPYYVAFNIGGQDVGLDPNGHSTGPIGYWNVDDIRKSMKELVAAGGRVEQEPKDVGGGKLVATVKDADGNVIGITQSA
jgi:predicted enzyme related to lactoylglutathione lyase